MRTPWKVGFPPVVVHQEREAVTSRWNYPLAKKHGDAKQALQLCDAFHNEDALGRLHDLTLDIDPAPIVLAPARAPGAAGNALGRTFARYVAKELGLEVANGIFQTNAVKRDQIKSPFFRMLQSPTFDGPVVEGASYLLADDVLTLGGTLASLRGFIESRGGIVVGMTALGEMEGRDAEIALGQNTLDMLRKANDGTLAAYVSGRTGFSLECLTEREGRYLLERPSVDDIRDGFDRAANGGA